MFIVDGLQPFNNTFTHNIHNLMNWVILDDLLLPGLVPYRLYNIEWA